MMITNNAILDNEKTMIEFLVNRIPNQAEIVVEQINKAKVTRDVYSPYFYVFDFQYEEPVPLLDETFKDFFDVQVLHNQGAPTVFSMVIRRKKVSMIEIYNADSSELHPLLMYEGDLFIKSYDWGE